MRPGSPTPAAATAATAACHPWQAWHAFAFGFPMEQPSTLPLTISHRLLCRDKRKKKTGKKPGAGETKTERKTEKNEEKKGRRMERAAQVIGQLGSCRPGGEALGAAAPRSEQSFRPLKPTHTPASLSAL